MLVHPAPVLVPALTHFRPRPRGTDKRKRIPQMVIDWLSLVLDFMLRS